MPGDDLRATCARCARGGAHKRSRADELALVKAVARRLDQSDAGVETLHQLWLTIGYDETFEEALGEDAAAVFAVEPATEKLRQRHFDGLRHRAADRRLRAAEWWLKSANGAPSRKREALLCAPEIVRELDGALKRERDPRVREALSGALALLVERFFPDRRTGVRLIELAGDRHSGVRFFAVQGLAGLIGRGADDRALAVVVERLADGSAGVRNAAARSLVAAYRAGRLSESLLSAHAASLEAARDRLEPDLGDALGQMVEPLALGLAPKAR